MNQLNELMNQFRLEDEDEYKRFLRMTPDKFNELIKLIETDIQKQNAHLHDAIPAKIKLAATLRFLATGSNYADLQHLFRVHKSTLSQFTPKVCEALYEKLLKGITYFRNLLENHILCEKPIKCPFKHLR